MTLKKAAAFVIGAALCLMPMNDIGAGSPADNTMTVHAESINDIPSDYQYAADWIWTNRIEREGSTIRRNTIFDQIAAGHGTLNYVIKWQSDRTVTYEQRMKFQKTLSDCINAWNDKLAGYENWPYEHIDVNVVGWAVIDKSCLIDLRDDEVVYTDTKYYDSQYDTSNGLETIPDKEPYAPDELSRFEHFSDPGYQYPGGADKRFDMYLWATKGFPFVGGCGGDWGQRLSDVACLALIEYDNLHVLEHEIGHGFGLTDFYGGEGESDGFPPGGFPGGENSIMMAGSSTRITDFDGWMLRYVWTKIKNDEGRFDLSEDINEPVEISDYYMGDINNNGIVDTSDAILLKKWLLAVPDTHIPNWKAGDLYRDEKLNVLDFCLLKDQLISGEPPEWISSQVPNDPGELITPVVSQFGKLTPTVGNCKMLSIFVEFADAKYSRALPAEALRQELFGSGNNGYPYDSISQWYKRASYGNLNIEGDVYYCTLPGNMADYMNSDRNFESFASSVLLQMDDQINYRDYDANGDGNIDCLSLNVPLDNADEATRKYWWSCTNTWWKNPDFSVDGMRISKFMTLGESPYKDIIKNLKSVMTHEMGHSMGLPDYYLYGSDDDWEAYHGDAGTERMDDSIGDFSSFSKLMYGWLREKQVQWYSGGRQSFELSDCSSQGSCLIIPINSVVGDINSEYFLVEYVEHNNNNTDLDIWTKDSGVRIFHIKAELKPKDWWGNTNFMYEQFSDYYQGQDLFRITRLINDNRGYYHTGDVCRFGTENFAAYDSNGYQTIDTGHTITIGELKDGKYTVTVDKP